MKGGIIVSNDFFRDLVDEDPSMREAIETRLLQYRFFGPDELWFPPDPLGKGGKNLEELLKF